MRHLAMTGCTHRARETVGGSAAASGTVWRGQAKRSGDGSTHRASERVRGSGRGVAWRFRAKLGEARLGLARLLTPHPFAGAAERRGKTMHGWAKRDLAMRGKHAALLRERGSLRGWVLQGWAGRGADWQTHSGFSEPLQFVRATRYGAMPGRDVCSTIIRPITGQFYDNRTNPKQFRRCREASALEKRPRQNARIRHRLRCRV